MKVQVREEDKHARKNAAFATCSERCFYEPKRWKAPPPPLFRSVFSGTCCVLHTTVPTVYLLGCTLSEDRVRTQAAEAHAQDDDTGQQENDCCFPERRTEASETRACFRAASAAFADRLVSLLRARRRCASDDTFEITHKLPTSSGLTTNLSALPHSDFRRRSPPPVRPTFGVDFAGFLPEGQRIATAGLALDVSSVYCMTLCLGLSTPTEAQEQRGFPRSNYLCPLLHMLFSTAHQPQQQQCKSQRPSGMRV